MLYLYEISSVLQALIFILQTYMRMFSWSELPGMSWFIHLSKQHFPMCPRGLCHFRTSILSYSPFGCCSAPKSCPTLCDTIEYTTPGFPCPSLSPRAYSNSRPSHQWCHPTISSFVVPVSSCLQSFPASGSFPMSWFFTSGGQRIGG